MLLGGIAMEATVPGASEGSQFAHARFESLDWRQLAMDSEILGAVIDRAIADIEQAGEKAFCSGALCEGSTVFSDDAVARSGDGFILKAGYDHYVAIYAHSKQRPEHSKARAKNAAMFILECLNNLCIRSTGTSIVTIADDYGRTAFIGALKAVQMRIRSFGR